jgi:hypothetical protein
MDFTSPHTGRWASPGLPDDLSPWPELEAAAENSRRLEREHREAQAAHGAAEQALKDAVAEDRAKLTEARLTGKKSLPKPIGVDAAKAALEEAARQRDAADDARQTAAQIVVDVVAKHRGEWVAKAEELADGVKAEEAAALEAYIATVEASARARETLSWLQRFPEKRDYKPTPGSVSHIGRRTEAVPWGDLVSALRIRAGSASPRPRTLKEKAEAAGLVPSPLIGGPKEGAAA